MLLNLLFLGALAFLGLIVILFATAPNPPLKRIKNVKTLLSWTEVIHCFLFGSPFKKLSANWIKNFPMNIETIEEFTISQESVDEYNLALQLKDEEQAPALADGIVPTGMLGMLAVRFAYFFFVKTLDFQHIHLLGLIARGAEVEVSRPLKVGKTYKVVPFSEKAKWVKKGLDLMGGAKIVDEEGEVAILAFKGLKVQKHKHAVPVRAPPKTFDDSNLVGEHVWNIHAEQPLKWLNISGDPNPIHLHPFLAKIFGMKSNIMHGSWMFAKAMSYFEREIGTDGLQLKTEMKFVSPMFLPATGKKAAVFKWYKTDNDKEFDLVIWTHRRGELVPSCIGSFVKK